eukprot:TRINITY_DN7512_c0_g1_i4.p2 TRINITY_DN7512_c0_g1~~TRINITY_DN7512_c0_g1_i4.p2  ORF type:complete len:155 (+),score=0.78 TRINITY_DN7512_c0_g1_i4:230-694(+)
MKETKVVYFKIRNCGCFFKLSQKNLELKLLTKSHVIYTIQFLCLSIFYTILVYFLYFCVNIFIKHQQHNNKEEVPKSNVKYNNSSNAIQKREHLFTIQIQYTKLSSHTMNFNNLGEKSSFAHPPKMTQKFFTENLCKVLQGYNLTTVGYEILAE